MSDLDTELKALKTDLQRHKEALEKSRVALERCRDADKLPTVDSTSADLHRAIPEIDDTLTAINEVLKGKTT